MGKKGGQNVCWAECVSAVSVLRMERAGENDGWQRESGGELGREAPPGLLSAPCSLQPATPTPLPPYTHPTPPLLGLWSHFRAELCWGLFLCGAPHLPTTQLLPSTKSSLSSSSKAPLFVCLFRAAPAAYGGSQARGRSELQLWAYTTATRDPSRVHDLRHSSQQCWTLNPLSGARDHTHILMDTSRVCLHRATTGTPLLLI